MGTHDSTGHYQSGPDHFTVTTFGALGHCVLRFCKDTIYNNSNHLMKLNISVFLLILAGVLVNKKSLSAICVYAMTSARSKYVDIS